MPLNTSRLRAWFATAAIVLVMIVAGFYFYARIRVRSAIKKVPSRLGVDVQQSTQGFTLSKSEGGHTLFTVHASRAVQYRDSGKAELRDVSIIVYGHQANRYDQIYGSDFDYDPKTGEVTANGEVHIDLEGNAAGPLNPDQATPEELKNPIHLKTSGLVFNARTGYASTKERIEFRVPQANGSAVGASYDSKAATLTLASDVVVHSTESTPATISARHGLITKGPNRAVLQGVHIASPSGKVAADEVTVYLRDDNTIEHILATGDIRAATEGATAAEVRSPRAEAWMNAGNALKSAVFSGGVRLSSAGERPMDGTAQELTVSFGPKNRADKVVASGDAKLLQGAGESNSARPIEIAAASIDFQLRNGRALRQAVTSGPAQVTVLPAPGASGQDAARTVATADRFEATFNAQGRIEHVTGSPNAKVLSTASGQPEKTSTSDHLAVEFNPAGNVAVIVQDGGFRYTEPAPPGGSARAAWAAHARYAPDTGLLILTGSPRVEDGGLTTTADTIRLDRRTGDATATGNVKSTYTELKPSPGGALLASSDPIHVTAPAMHALRSSGVATYSGGARLWQGASAVQAPVIEFNRNSRALVAKTSTTDTSAASVTTTFAQQGKDGKVTPVSVRSAVLNYVDGERKALFQGGVLVHGADTTITADAAEVYFPAAGRSSAPPSQAGPSQIEKIVAQGHVNIQQPTRQATGQKLVYTASDGRFVLTGGPPSIFDAERGKITGGSLTFYNRDDRVVVESTNSAPTVTRTRITK